MEKRKVSRDLKQSADGKYIKKFNGRHTIFQGMSQLPPTPTSSDVTKNTD